MIEIQDEIPAWVWRKNAESNEWAKEKFIGYPLIEEYTKGELAMKLPIIESVMLYHWKESTFVHGDLTHFNVLLDAKDQFHFIDRKKTSNPKIFDLFYFYAYLRQSVERCMTLSEKHARSFVLQLERIMVTSTKETSRNEISHDLSLMKLPSKHGLRDANLQTYKSDFIALFS